jgi:hypothetical protein
MAFQMSSKTFSESLIYKLGDQAEPPTVDLEKKIHISLVFKNENK